MTCAFLVVVVDWSLGWPRLRVHVVGRELIMSVTGWSFVELMLTFVWAVLLDGVHMIVVAWIPTSIQGLRHPGWVGIYASRP